MKNEDGVEAITPLPHLHSSCTALFFPLSLDGSRRQAFDQPLLEEEHQKH